MMKECYCKLSPCALGVSLGLLWGVGLFLLGLAAWCFNWGDDLVVLLGSVYIGYKATLLGSLLGFVWGFVDFFIAGIIGAWLYNWIAKCKYCKVAPEASSEEKNE